MAHRIRTTGLVLVLVASFWAMASAQSSGCTNTIISLSPCLNYIQGNSSTPSSGCCSQLSSVVSSQPKCLCEVLNGGSSSLGININQTQALALPGACKVQTPPLSQCNAASPAGSPAGTTDPSNTPSGTRSKTVPTKDDGTSDGSSNKMSIPLLFLAILAAAYTSA
ncbi:Non-specific lipid-transfer protein-like protein [Morus notabilis]|uniref:Non-specific lipid-transfer protein-like protein n=1 Tax=Morus notabilis TaxID=981085 RepID=W9RBG7_9ROSA|nr:non-specific lipid-transfer protein-like protein At2g13820 [Morus notabilis]EXB63475.1 Non-specific lipid-transfer protein-like protein [Morus notabilis]